MELINDLGTDLALAFLVEKRFRQKIESKEAAKLIGRIRRLLESTAAEHPYEAQTEGESGRHAHLHANHA
jgi:hypothetical protein